MHAEFHINNEWGIKNFEDFLNFIKSSVFGRIKKWLRKTNALKVNFDVCATYRRKISVDFEGKCSTKLQTRIREFFQKQTWRECMKIWLNILI